MFIWNKLCKIFGVSETKTDDSVSTHSSLSSVQKKAKKQMEFYFSPSNIQRNAHMKQLVDENDDRFCKISEFMKFNKIIELNISEDDLLSACAASRKLEVDEGRRMVRTKVPYKADPRIDFRTVFVKGLDKDETMDSLRKMFEKQFGKVNYISMRNIIDKESKGKKFSGKADVEFDKEEVAAEAIEKGFEYKGVTLPLKIVAALKEEEANKETPNKPGRQPKASMRVAKLKEDTKVEKKPEPQPEPETKKATPKRGRKPATEQNEEPASAKKGKVSPRRSLRNVKPA